MRFGLSLAMVSLGAMALAGCGGGGGTAAPLAVTPTPSPSPPPPPPPPPPSSEREVNPAQTGAGIAEPTRTHFAVNPNPAVTAKGRLFVMLPGTTAVPRVYREIVRTGASRGYHALGLAYPNDDAIKTLCNGNADPDCAGKARREVILGDNGSPVVSVDRANSIENRLIALLTFLNSSFPSEGWGQYLSGGSLNWSLITVAGHSQGGGHAGYLAKLYALDRAVMLSSPADVGLTAGTPASWLSLPNITPVARQYGFTHVADDLVPMSLALANWRTIGLESNGPVQSVDGVSAPFNNSRMLTTAATPNPAGAGLTASATHGAPVVDVVVPLAANGDLLFRPVWIYLAFP